MDGPSWEAIWPLLHLDDVVQLRTSPKFLEQGQQISCGELFFFMMQKESYVTPGDFVSTPFDAHVFMRWFRQESFSLLRDFQLAHDSELAWAPTGTKMHFGLKGREDRKRNIQNGRPGYVGLGH